MDVNELGSLEEMSSSINRATESLNGMSNAASGGGKNMGGLAKAAKTATSPILGMAEAAGNFVMRIGQTISNITNLANQIDQLETQHKLFNREWAKRFQEFEFQKETVRLGAIRAEIAHSKANQIVDFQGQKMPLEIAKARLNIEQSRLNLEQAQIAAARAELDYTNKLYSIENNLLSARKAAAEAPQNYVKALASIYEPFIKIDQAASTYTKTVGGSRESMKALRKETIDLGNERHLQAKYNTSVEELINLQTKYNAELGRSVKLTNGQKEGLAALRQVYGDDKAIEFATKLSSFGYDMTRASGLAGKLFAEASKRGIALDKYSKNLLTNIKMAQTLTFEKGINGLKEMAARATELNFNMQETAKASEKLSTLEGALEASSQLAVLGGNFSLFSNPLAMFHEALSDAEGLQDRIINQFSGLASWDSNRGQIYMSGYDRIRMREAAKAMGMDPSEVSNMVFEKARRDKLAPEISRLGVSDEIGRLLSNVAQLDENGNGYININGNKTSLQEAAQMNPEELSKILRTQDNSDSENIAEIAQSVLSIKDNVEGWSKSLGDTMASSLEDSGIGDAFGESVKRESTTADVMSRFANDVLKTSRDKAEFDKRMAAWNKEYAESTYGYEKQMAKIQMNQTKLAELSADYNYKTALYSVQEAKLSLAQLDLSLRQARFNEEISLPLQEEELKLSFRRAKRMDDIYEIQRMLLVIQGITQIGRAFGPLGTAIGSALGGIVSIGTSIYHLVRNFKSDGETLGKIAGIDTSGYNKFKKPDIEGTFNYAKNYNVRDLENRFDTGGKVNNYGGLLIGPSHSDGGIRIEAQGGEYIMPREQTAMYYGILEAMRSKSFPTGNGGFNSMSVNNTNTSIFSGGYLGGGSENRTNEPLRLDVTGTITLDLSGSTANIDAEDLLKEPLLSQLVAAISRSQNNYNNYGVASEKNLFGPWRI